MKKRKLLSLTLAGAMVLGMLSACGEKTPDPTPTPEAEVVFACSHEMRDNSWLLFYIPKK